jgi:septum formation inhibitor MinC
MFTERFAAARWRVPAGNDAARIFCQKIEAELLAIKGYYQTAEEINVALRNRPAPGVVGKQHNLIRLGR